MKSFRERGSRFSTHLGLLFPSFPSLIFQARLSATNRVDMSFRDVRSCLRAEVVEHLVAEAPRGFSLEQGRLGECTVRIALSETPKSSTRG